MSLSRGIISGSSRCIWRPAMLPRRLIPAKRSLATTGTPSNALPRLPQPAKSAANIAGVIVFTSIVGGTFYLGCWQLGRYFKKVELVEKWLEEVKQAPLDVSEGPLPVSASMRPLQMTGVVWPGREVRVTPRTPPAGTPPRILPPATGSQGYLSVMPFQRADGSWLLLARGWQPTAPWDAGAAALPSQPLTVTGVLRKSEEPGQWAVKHYPERSEFSFLDAPAIATALGLPAPSDTPVFEVVRYEDGDPPAVFPLARSAASLAEPTIGPQTHLAYTAVWFSLAAFGAVATRRMFRGGGRLLGGRGRRV